MATYNPRQLYEGQWWTLFAMSAFPLHLWTLIQVFRDFATLSERSTSWDALGVGAYGLLFALGESFFVFVVVLLLGLLVHPTWGREKRTALLSILVLIVAGWAMLQQVYLLQGWGTPQAVLQFLITVNSPLRWLYIFVFLLVLPTIALPAYFILRSEKALNAAHALIERLTLLSTLYLLLDIGAFLVVVTRNLT